jgi:26S proteasome regulatory subunit N10
MRNGDYSPSRLEAQADAAQMLANVKLQANVENAVSIITMGGES